MGKKWDINERTMKVENRKGRDEMELPCAAAEKLSPMSILVSFGKKMGKEQCKVDIVWCPRNLNQKIPGYCTPVLLISLIWPISRQHMDICYGRRLHVIPPLLIYMKEGRKTMEGEYGISERRRETKHRCRRFRRRRRCRSCCGSPHKRWHQTVLN